MGTFLAVAVGIGFAWSVVLFAIAVVGREREQEDGFGWALAGAVLFLVVFCDRLPGDWTGPRELIGWVMPWSDAAAQEFTSSLVALTMLFVVYVYRIAVFYYLIFRDPESLADDSYENRANDRVAPLLSYVSFVICAVALLQPVWGLGPVATVLVAAGFAVAYYWSVIPILLQALANLGKIARIAWVKTRHAVGKAVLAGIVLIVRAEKYRRGGAPGRVTEWIDAREDKLEADEEQALKDQKAMIVKAAQEAS